MLPNLMIVTKTSPLSRDCYHALAEKFTVVAMVPNLLIELPSSDDWALLLIDVASMDDLGTEVAQQLPQSATPVLYLDEPNGMFEGGKKIHKPVEPEALMHAITELLGEWGKETK